MLTHDELMELRNRVILSAHNFIGIHEIPLGSNRGKWIDTFNTFVGNPLGSPWCAAGLCWVANAAGVKNAPKTGSSGAIVQWGHDHHAIVISPSYGDAGEVKDDTSPTGYCHTVLIVGGPYDALHTIEFNESDGVCSNIRHGDTMTFVNIYAMES